jgi:hypothetical protein
MVYKPEKLFPKRDSEHFLGTLLLSQNVPATRSRLGQSLLSEAQGKFKD